MSGRKRNKGGECRPSGEGRLSRMGLMAVMAAAGGQGRTVATANLACLSALGGREVWALDGDPEGGLGAHFGLALEAPWAGEAEERHGVRVRPSPGPEAEVSKLREEWRRLSRAGAVWLDSPSILTVAGRAAAEDADEIVVVTLGEPVAVRRLAAWLERLSAIRPIGRQVHLVLNRQSSGSLPPSAVSRSVGLPVEAALPDYGRRQWRALAEGRPLVVEDLEAKSDWLAVLERIGGAWARTGGAA